MFFNNDHMVCSNRKCPFEEQLERICVVTPIPLDLEDAENDLHEAACQAAGPFWYDK